MRVPRCTSVVVVAFLASISTEVSATSSAAVVDHNGLEYVNSAAFCAVHCKPWRRRRQLSECTSERCPHYHTRRALAEAAEQEKTIGKVTLLTCGDVTLPSHITMSIDSDVTNDAVEQRNVFRGFQSTFFRAYDAMITSANATYEACQLELLQSELFPKTSELRSDPNDELHTTNKPMLIKLHAAADDQRACMAQIHAIWATETFPTTPFLSRQDQTRASRTIVLAHMDQSIAKRVNALDCVESVLELPAILKLMPFARSAYQLSFRRDLTHAPSMELRLVRGSDRTRILERLQSRLQAVDGVTNVFFVDSSNVAHQQRPYSIFTMPLAQLELWSHAIAVAVSDPAVEWVDVQAEISQNAIRHHHVPTPTRRLDEYVDSLVGVEAAHQRGIRGNDVIVGMTDSGIYIDHDQFDQPSRNIYDTADLSARKIVYYKAWANAYDESEDVTCGHGTHVAGILAGSSFSGNAPNFGIADAAKIAFMDIGGQSPECAGLKGCAVKLATPGDASDLLSSQMSVGARIFSFSWGTPGSDYSDQARALDEFLYRNPDVLIIAAAGNSGEDTITGARTISSPSGAKNVISVGASLNAAESFTQFPCANVYNPQSVASFSSAGPTTDGRQKPDVVAPGMTLLSSQSLRPGLKQKTSATCALQGTSQATPVVTGLAVLLYEWLRDGWWKSGVKNAEHAMKTIPAALLKALIIHSGDSLKRRLARTTNIPTSCNNLESDAFPLSYPDLYQGYGKPNMSNIADFTDPTLTPSLYFLPNSSANSEPRVAHQQEVTISFTVPRGVDLRATIVWTDPPGSVRSTTQLQHDLDLSVRIRNSTKTFYPLTADNTTKRDDRNNVEMVQVLYEQLVEALASEPNGNALIGPAGEIVVEAVIYGQSVLQYDSQAFAFVASSSVIGTASGIASAPAAESFWTPYTYGGVAAGALVLLAVIAGCVRCCMTRKHHRHGGGRTPPPGVAGGATYVAHATPAVGRSSQQQQPRGSRARGARRNNIECCPHCQFSCSDPVRMVNHVETMHAAERRGAGGVSAEVANGQKCPYCAFASPDPVIMVNHVELMHDLRHARGTSASAPAPAVDPVSGEPVGASPAQRCPYCPFATSDAVVMVNHVENMHGTATTGSGVSVNGSGAMPMLAPPPSSAYNSTSSNVVYPPPYSGQNAFGYPQLGAHVAAPVGHNVASAGQNERCPYCTFASTDPVILVNHVEHMHS